MGQGQAVLGKISGEMRHDPAPAPCERLIHPLRCSVVTRVGAALPADARRCRVTRLCPAPATYCPPPQASETPNTNYNTIVAGLRNISHAGESPTCWGRDGKGRNPGGLGWGGPAALWGHLVQGKLVGCPCCPHYVPGMRQAGCPCLSPQVTPWIWPPPSA